MKQNKIKSALSAVATCSCSKLSLAAVASIIALAPLAQVASAEVTAPVGYVKLTFNAESDTPFSLPMDRPKVYAGQVASISGNEITVANNDFTANELVYVDGTQNEKFYLLFTTGTLEGKTFDVTANSVNSITVDQDGDDDVQTLINDAAATDNFSIRPHWTLNTVFPDGEGMVAMTQATLLNPQGELLLHENITPGLNNTPSVNYIYYDDPSDSGNAGFKGWYVKGAYTTKVNDLVMRRTDAFVMRNRTTAAEVINVIGDVPLVDAKNELVVLSDFIKQDNYKPSLYPIDISLNELFTSLNTAGFVKSTNPTFPEGDLVLLYDDNPFGLNATPSKTYLYFDHTDNTNDGWYLLGNVNPGQKVGDTKLIKAGKIFVVRKGEEAESKVLMNTNIPYDPFAP